MGEDENVGMLLDRVKLASLACSVVQEPDDDAVAGLLERVKVAWLVMAQELVTRGSTREDMALAFLGGVAVELPPGRAMDAIVDAIIRVATEGAGTMETLGEGSGR